MASQNDCASGQTKILPFQRRGPENLPDRWDSSRSPDERRDGRSPGSPIFAFGRLPKVSLSGIVACSSWLTVAGTAPDSHRLPS